MTGRGDVGIGVQRSSPGPGTGGVQAGAEAQEEPGEEHRKERWPVANNQTRGLAGVGVRILAG